ncbi:MAG: flagellar basal body rod protein FlgB [Burkholderiaceae bacterium]
MLDRLTEPLSFHAEALRLRAERQRVLANNIANADTPGFAARDFDFAAALRQAAEGSSVLDTGLLRLSDTRHMRPSGDAAFEATTLKFRRPEQPSMDGNTVDIDAERANFADNSMRYEASLRFINGNVRNILSAIRGE